MKNLIIMIFLLSSFSAMAINPQGGNGGNICYYNPRNNACWNLRSACYNMEGYRVLDEFQYNYLASHDTLVYGQSGIRGRIPSPLHENIFQTDLTKTRAGKSALKKLKKVSGYNWWLSQTFIDIFHSLRETYISNRRFLMPKGASLEKWSICYKETLEAAILTDDEGITVISEEAWDLLPIQSQEVLLIHETLRVAQTYSVWFKEVSNKDLQMLTMAIYSQASGLVLRHPFYKKFIKFNSRKDGDQELAKLSSEIDDAIQSGQLGKAALLSYRKGESRPIGKNMFPIADALRELRNKETFRKKSEEKNGIYLIQTGLK